MWGDVVGGGETEYTLHMHMPKAGAGAGTALYSIRTFTACGCPAGAHHFQPLVFALVVVLVQAGRNTGALQQAGRLAGLVTLLVVGWVIRVYETTSVGHVTQRSKTRQQ